MRKTRPIRAIPAKAKDALVHFGPVPVPEGNRAEFTAAVLAVARNSVEAFPGQIEAVRSELRRTFPARALSAFVAYGLTGQLNENGDLKRNGPKSEQHHAELLQALSLTLPLNDWKNGPLTQDTLQQLFELMPSLSDSFVMQGLVASDLGDDLTDARVVRNLQNRMRLNTNGVRNWGPYAQVVQTSRNLYANLDVGIAGHHGFFCN